MGRSWHGGKGDGSRVSNHKSYRDSPLWDKHKSLFVNDEIGYVDPIVVNPSIVTETRRRKCLFLDDIRMPQHAFLWDDNKTLYEGSGIIASNWAIVRSYEQFVEYIEKNGIPDVVSFDNDLFDVTDYSVPNDVLVKQFAMTDWENFPIKTGAHCAQYLVAQCAAQNKPVPKYYVHSANNMGRKVIRKILEDAIQSKI